MVPKRANWSIFNPWWVSGFIDGECSFIGSVYACAHITFGYRVQLTFAISQHINEEALMQKFIPFFGCGSVNLSGPNALLYRIRDRRDLEHYLSFPAIR
jgi:LAGLIDADG endonuclease